MRKLAIVGLLAGAVTFACSSGSQNGSDRDPTAPVAVADAGTQTSYAPADAAPPSADAGGPNATDASGEAVTVAPFHIVGRFDDRDPAGPRFGYPGTQVRARFSGTGISVELADTDSSHYDVSIDGAEPTLLIVSGSRKMYELASGLPAGTHDVVLTKRTETFAGITQFIAFHPAAGGAIVPSPAPTGRKIEMIGDSITCGWGVLGTEATCPFDRSTECEPRSWGALAAKQLSAIQWAVAYSGIGVLRNADGNTTSTMLDRYPRALADDPSSTWSVPQTADLVVVALGTNDFVNGKGDPGPTFQTRYVELLGTVRSKYPSAWIVVATSPMLSGDSRARLQFYAQNAVSTRISAGDAKISFLDIDEQSAADGFGCGYHPNVVTAQKMAAKLVTHVKPLLGW